MAILLRSLSIIFCPPDGRLALVAATRYMVAQRLRRNVLFSRQNALKLQRGEALNEEA